MPNGWGIVIDQTSSGNLVGGVGAGQGNVFANSSPNAGVKVEGAGTTGNTVRGNSIYNNAFAGIYLQTGGNAALAAPLITNVAGGRVSGFTCSLCTVDVYNDLAGQGRVYAGSGTAQTNGAFDVYVSHALPNITATATDAIGNTSEFSAPFAAAPNTDGDALPDSADGCTFEPEDYDLFDDGDGCPEADNDGDGICDSWIEAAAGCSGIDVGLYSWEPPLGGTVDCSNVAEDIDSFHDGDGCPEPDTDYDNYPDATDDCPATDGNVGADGIADTGDEPVLYLTPYQAREDFDGIIDTDGCHDSPNDDYDGDGLGDETEVLSLGTDPVNPDTDADGMTDSPDNCPAWPNPAQNSPPWTVPANDADCDGFNKVRENWVGTLPAKRCPNTATPNDEAPDSWPTDFNDSRTTNLSDVVLMGPVYNQPTGTDPAKKRFDLNASGGVNLSDVVLIGPFYNKNCG
jgi:parallel beta-helix repeat protein